MVASFARRSPLAARSMFGIAILFAATGPVAHQDLASLLASQPSVAESARNFVRSGAFASLRTAAFSLPSPLGMTIPQLPVTDHFASITASLPGARATEPLDLEPARTALPVVNRGGKADRLLPTPKTNVQNVGPRKIEDDIATVDTGLSVVDVEPFGPEAEFAGTIARAVDPLPAAGALLRVTTIVFNRDEIQLPPLAFEHLLPSPVARLKLASLSDGTIEEGASVAAKGVVTGDDATPKSPSERLGLSGSKRAKAEKCLADAVYFESRGEAERGQIAVAQVVINRVFSGFYPEDVCETVYQNAHRHLACQFTFACEGKKLIVNDQPAWIRATRISRDMLDGKLWLNDVGKATHYHAYWVKPAWVREMRTIQKIGVHTFYRPRKWDEG
jgi:hypothetical protein